MVRTINHKWAARHCAYHEKKIELPYLCVRCSKQSMAAHGPKSTMHVRQCTMAVSCEGGKGGAVDVEVYSYAPMSKPAPCGRAAPLKSALGAYELVPLSISGLFACKE